MDPVLLVPFFLKSSFNSEMSRSQHVRHEVSQSYGFSHRNYILNYLSTNIDCRMCGFSTLSNYVLNDLLMFGVIVDIAKWLVIFSRVNWWDAIFKLYFGAVTIFWTKQTRSQSFRTKWLLPRDFNSYRGYEWSEMTPCNVLVYLIVLMKWNQRCEKCADRKHTQE